MKTTRDGFANSNKRLLEVDNLTGGNGIAIVKNTAGDKVEAKLAIPETGPIKLVNNGAPRPAITLESKESCPPFQGGVMFTNKVITTNTQIGHGGIRIGAPNGPVLYLIGAGSVYEEMPSGTQLYYLNQGNVKTVNGQSIYGSGNIDTTPTLKTVNSTSLTGSGNIYLKEFGVTNSNELNFKASASMSDLYVGLATISETGATQTGYTIGSYKFMKGTGSTSAFADLYCAKLYTSSDERLKENIKPYEPTASVLDLSIKEFNYKDSKVKSVGVIAQEVQKLFPDAVSVDKKSGYLSVDDRSLMYMLMAEVKKLRDRVNELEGR